MITLTCPECGEQYQLDDSMAGKKAACSCGAVLFVPDTPDIPEGAKACPVCKKITESSSVICVSCGYNYQTGGRMRSAETRVEKEDPKTLALARTLWKPAVITAIIMFSSFIAYRCFFVKNYGISSKNPLGTIQAIDTHLSKYGFKKLENADKLPEALGQGNKKIEWKDIRLEESSKGMFSETVFIIADSQDSVLAIGANFKGGLKTVPGDTGSATGRFMSSFWKDTELPFPPDFQPIREGEGRWSYTFLKAKATTNSVCGEWIEYPSDVLIIPSSHTMLISKPELQNISFETVKGKNMFGFGETEAQTDAE
ncbi:MAG: hypothetical protein JW808_04130 [Victivallales bacterium]|nr:hypothetical protein [Victivallales bacterium]